MPASESVVGDVEISAGNATGIAGHASWLAKGPALVMRPSRRITQRQRKLSVAGASEIRMCMNSHSASPSGTARGALKLCSASHLPRASNKSFNPTAQPHARLGLRAASGAAAG